MSQEKQSFEKGEHNQQGLTVIYKGAVELKQVSFTFVNAPSIQSQWENALQDFISNSIRARATKSGKEEALTHLGAIMTERAKNQQIDPLTLLYVLLSRDEYVGFYCIWPRLV